MITIRYFLILLFLSFSTYAKLVFVKGDTTIEGQYSISAFLDKPIVNPGDTATISLFFVGEGWFDGEMSFNYIIPYSICSEKSWLTTFMSKTGYKDGVPHLLDRIIKVDTLHTYQNEFALPKHYFMKPINGTIFGSHITKGNTKIYAPATLNFIIPKNAPPGLHNIDLKLIYQCFDKYKISNANCSIKIQSFGERYQAWLLAILSIILVYAPIYQNWINKTFNKRIYKILSSFPIFIIIIIVIMAVLK